MFSLKLYRTYFDKQMTYNWVEAIYGRYGKSRKFTITFPDTGIADDAAGHFIHHAATTLYLRGQFRKSEKTELSQDPNYYTSF